MALNVLLYRKALKKSQKDIAEYIGISVDGYARKERGENEFKISEMEKIVELVKAEIPSVTIDDIFFNEKLRKFTR